MKKWKARVLNSLSDLPAFVLAWFSQVLAFLGGAFAAETFIGDSIETVLEWLPWAWVPVAMFAGVVLGVLLDLLWDALPERIALWGAFAAPSIATAVPGRLGDTVSGWGNDLQDVLKASLSDWLGDQPAVGLAVVCMIGVFLGAKYALPKHSGGGRI